MLRAIKKEIRIIGWDDSPFSFHDTSVRLVGVVCRGGTQIDGVLTTEITKDGLDVTEKIAHAVNASVHKDQLRAIMLDGITFGGFNITDIKALRKKTGLPVIVVIRDKPDMNAIKKSLSKFPDSEERWNLIRKAGNIYEIEIRNRVLEGKRTLYYQKSGLSESECEKIINLTAVNSVVPEPVRVAHIICSGIRKMPREK
jgi:hypothetical protein